MSSSPLSFLRIKGMALPVEDLDWRLARAPLSRARPRPPSRRASAPA